MRCRAAAALVDWIDDRPRSSRTPGQAIQPFDETIDLLPACLPAARCCAMRPAKQLAAAQPFLAGHRSSCRRNAAEVGRRLTNDDFPPVAARQRYSAFIRSFIHAMTYITIYTWPARTVTTTIYQAFTTIIDDLHSSCCRSTGAPPPCPPSHHNVWHTGTGKRSRKDQQHI